MGGPIQFTDESTGGFNHETNFLPFNHFIYNMDIYSGIIKYE